MEIGTNPDCALCVRHGRLIDNEIDILKHDSWSPRKDFIHRREW